MLTQVEREEQGVGAPTRQTPEIKKDVSRKDNQTTSRIFSAKHGTYKAAVSCVNASVKGLSRPPAPQPPRSNAK